MVKLIALVIFNSLMFAGSASNDPADWLNGWLLPDPGLFLWTLVTFGIVLFILKWKAWGPLMAALDEREKRINDALSSADKAKEEAEKVSNEYDEMIKRAQAEAQQIISKAKDAGNSLKDEIERKATEKAENLIQKSNKQIDAAKAKAIDEIKSVSVDLAIQAASKVIDKNLDDSTNRELAKSIINEAN